MNFFTYLIVEILECERDKLTLWYTSHTEIKPCTIVLGIHVWTGITGHPDVKVVLLEATGGLGHVTTAELAAEHDLRLGDLPSCPSREALYEGATVG